MAQLPLPITKDDGNLDTAFLSNDFDIEQYHSNQQWSMLGKALEIYLLWFLTLMILYALAFAGLMYVRSQKKSHAASSAQASEAEQTSGNTLMSINDKDLYPILNLAGGQSSVYLKYLDIDQISNSKMARPDDREQRQHNGDDS